MPERQSKTQHHMHAALSLASLRDDLTAVEGFNAKVAVLITSGVGTMACAYVFAAIALISLPNALSAGRAALVSWIAQTFLQLVLLSIILVGQRVQATASDARSARQFEDTEIILDRLDTTTTGGLKDILAAIRDVQHEIRDVQHQTRALASERTPPAPVTVARVVLGKSPVVPAEPAKQGKLVKVFPVHGAEQEAMPVKPVEPAEPAAAKPSKPPRILASPLVREGTKLSAAARKPASVKPSPKPSKPAKRQAGKRPSAKRPKGK